MGLLSKAVSHSAYFRGAGSRGLLQRALAQPRKADKPDGMDRALGNRLPRLSPDKSPPARVPAPSGGSYRFLKEELAKFHKMYAPFQGLILASPDGGDLVGFIRELTGRVASFGVVIPLASRRGLVLFPRSPDRELMAHRLSRDLGAVPVFYFEADTPAAAFSLLEPHL